MAFRKCALGNLVMNVDFWKGRRVLVTGHTGFKGGWLSLWLQSMGATVTGYALAPPEGPSLFHSAQVGEGMRSVLADIRDADALASIVSDVRPEVVFHLAAQPLVRYSYANPIETYATNVLGLVHLFEAIRSAGCVRAVVNVTSDKCYDNKEWSWGYRENDPLGGRDPYSNSKGCAEMVTAAYRSSYFSEASYAQHGVALASARAGNVIGGGDWAADRLIPDLIRAFSSGQPVRIRNPHSIRPWQHVLEPLRGYLLLAERLYTDGPVFAEAWNFGPNERDAREVGWIVEKMQQLWGEGARWEKDEAQHVHEAVHLKLDCAKAHERLQWVPRWDLHEALEHIVQWHQAERRGENMKAITLEQIRLFQDGQEDC